MRKVACPHFLSVRDRHQRKGLGCKLVGVLIDIGREKVIDGIVGQVAQKARTSSILPAR